MYDLLLSKRTADVARFFAFFRQLLARTMDFHCRTAQKSQMHSTIDQLQLHLRSRTHCLSDPSADDIYRNVVILTYVQMIKLITTCYAPTN